MRFIPKLAGLLLALAVVGFLGGPAFAQATTHVTGRVLGGSGRPVAGALVRLAGGNVILVRYTDRHGDFGFFGLSVGRYELDATAHGVTGRTTVVLTSAGADAVVIDLLKVVGTVASRPARALAFHGSGTDTVVGPTELADSPDSGSVSGLLRQLPGAARGADGVVHINGDHGDVNYVVDGVPLPTSLDRQIGTQLDPSDISFLDVIEGAYPAQYGDHFAATINVDTRTGVAGPPGLRGYVAGGSYGDFDQALTYQSRIGAGSLVAGIRDERKDWMLDPPGYQNIHNQGSNADQFLRYTLVLNARDYLDFFVTHALRRYQIPPDIAAGAPASTDDNEEQNETFASFQMHHALRGDGALTYGVSFDRSKIVDFNDPQNDFLYGERLNLSGGGTAEDCASGAVSACGFSVYANRDARDAIFNISNSLLSAHHDVRWGAIEDVTDVAKLYQVTLQPNSFLDPVNARPPDLTGYTCAGSAGICTVTDDHPNIGLNTQAYLEDSWRIGDAWQFDYGMRYDAIGVRSSQFSRTFTQLSPRVKLTRLWGKRASVYVYYGRFFTPFALENVDPSDAYVINSPLQRSAASFDLQPERDSDYEVGAHLPVGRGELGLRVMQKNATNWIDDTQVGTTALFQNINYALGRVAVQGATYSYPLARSGTLESSLVHTYAEDKGCETQLLAPCEGGNSQLNWGPADHDQRWDESEALTLPDRRGGWISASSEYGSGLTTAPGQCAPATDDCKVPPHLIFNVEKGIGLGAGRGAIYVRISNLLNDRYYVTYANAQGNHVGAPRDIELGYRLQSP